MIETGYIPPQAIDLEKNVLGAAMQSKYGLTIFSRMMSASDFYSPQHILIAEKIVELWTSGRSVDIQTVYHSLSGTQRTEVDLIYLMQMTNGVASAAHMESWCQIVKEKSIGRQLIKMASVMVDEAYKGEVAPSDLLTDAQQKLLHLGAETMHGDLSPRDISDVAMKEMTSPSSDGIVGIPIFGIHDLDYQLNGAEAGDLILIAARPSMGKSMLANTIVGQCQRIKVPMMMWGLEMDERQNYKMYTSNVGELDYTKVKRGLIKGSDPRLNHVYDTYNAERHIHFIGRTGVNVGAIRAKITEYKAEHDIQLAVIDHGRLIRKNMLKGFNDIEEISLITQILKQTAKELRIPIILLWQLSRDTVKAGGSKRPDMSHLRGSGTLEEDADKIALIHRDYYYTKEGDPSYAQIDCAKVRAGETGIVDVAFVPERARFEAWHGDGAWSDEGDIFGKKQEVKF